MKVDIQRIEKNQIAILLLIMMLAGAVLNLIAISTNNGRMPVMTEYELNTNKHFAYQEEHKELINNWILTDIIHVANKYVASIGDFLILLPIIFLIINRINYYKMIIKNRKNKTFI